MTEPLTNAILASILHLIWRDLAGNRRVPPCRAPPRWVPSRRAPTRRRRRHPCISRPRVATPPPQYRPMEPMPLRVPEQSLLEPPLPQFGVPYIPRSQVDLGRLAGPPEGATPIHGGHTKWQNPYNRRRKKGVIVVEPLTRSTTDLSIIDGPATPYHRADRPSPTPDKANPNPNRLGSGSPP
jgi:hypothetical protein